MTRPTPARLAGSRAPLPSPREARRMPRSPQPAASLSRYQAMTGEAATEVPPRVRWEVAVRYSSLHPIARLVALTLATYMDWERMQMRNPTSATRLARACRIPQSSARMTLRVLEEHGWIERQEVPDGEVQQIQLLIPGAVE
jgi:hypothetical protein